MAFRILSLVLVVALTAVQGSDIGGSGGSNYLGRIRREAEAAKTEAKEDPECRQYEQTSITAPVSAPPECCACSDCKLAGLKEASIEKCEAILKPDTEAILASNKGNGAPIMASLTIAVVNGSGQANASSSSESSESSSLEIKAADIKTIRECMTECVFNESGYLSPNAKLNEQAIMKDFKEGFKDAQWAPIAQKTYTKCIDAAKKASQTGKCKSGAEEFMMCLAREKYLSCPQQSWNQSNPECEKIKGRLAKCTNLAPPY